MAHLETIREIRWRAYCQALDELVAYQCEETQATHNKTRQAYYRAADAKTDAELAALDREYETYLYICALPIVDGVRVYIRNGVDATICYGETTGLWWVTTGRNGKERWVGLGSLTDVAHYLVQGEN